MFKSLLAKLRGPQRLEKKSQAAVVDLRRGFRMEFKLVKYTIPSGMPPREQLDYLRKHLRAEVHMKQIGGGLKKLRIVKDGCVIEGVGPTLAKAMKKLTATVE